MKVQLLVSTMHQENYNLLEQMNIQTDAIVINQCDRNSIEDIEYRGKNVKWISLNERGIGLSRNSALMRSDADILLFADDDCVYDKGYEEKIIKVFERYPKASLIVFNLVSLNPDRPEFFVEKDYKLRWFNCLKFGAFRIAVKRDAILKNNIFYSLLFGGGAKYQAGEDNLFITNCIQSGLIGIASSECIGTVKQEESTWFKGYNEKYYYDRGALFSALYRRSAWFYLLLMELKDKKCKDIKFLRRYTIGLKGIKEY